MSKSRYLTTIKICIIAIFLILIAKSNFFSIFRKELNWDIFWAGLIVQPIVFFCFIILSIRHVLLISKPKIKLSIAFRSIILSQGLNLIFPARLSELLKATYLRDRANVPLSSGISAVFLERSVDVLIVATLGLLGFLQYFDRGNFLSIIIVGLGLAVAIFILVHSPRLVQRIIHAIPSPHLVSFLEQTYQHFSAVAGTKAFCYALFLGAGAWGLSYINILVFLELSGSIPVGFSGALLVFVLTTLGGAIPALPGGLGTYEAAAVIALRSLGYSFEEALALSLTMHIAQLILPFIMATFIMLTERLGVSSLIADLLKNSATKNVSDKKSFRRGRTDD